MLPARPRRHRSLAFVTFDTTRPNVTINVAAGQLDPAIVAGAPINFTAVFSEAVTGFTAADVSFTGSTVTGTLVATIVGGGATYNVAVTGMTGTTGNVVVTIPANGCTDLAGNLNFASTSTDNTVAYAPDTTAPAPSIDRDIGQADPTSVSPILFQVGWSEPVIGFTASDISFVGSTVGGTLSAVVVQTSGTTHSVTVTGMATVGNVVASIPAGVCTDAAGNPNIASVSTDNVVAWTGSAWPDTTNTGPQAGTVFTPASGVINTSSDGQIIQNLNLAGSVHVRHSNVTIRDCNINMDGFFFGVDTDGVAHTNLTILRCKMFATSLGANSCIDFNSISGSTISFCDLSGKENGIFIGGSCNIHDNYIHDLGGSGTDPHVDGIQNAGASNVLIEHNNILAYDTSCIIMQNEGGSFSNCTINNNRLVGVAPLSHGILCQAKDEFPANTCSNIIITNNRVDNATFKVFLHNVNGYTFTGNVVDSTGLPFALDDGGGNTVTAPGAITFESTATQAGSSSSRSHSVTGAAAVGQERLVAVLCIAQSPPSALAFAPFTIDGQAATQVGSYVRVVDSGGNGPVVSFWRAPGTANTTFNVDFVTVTGLVFDTRVVLWTLANVGTLLNTVSDTTTGSGDVGNMDLNINTAASGVVAAAFLAYNSTSHSTISWTGLTQSHNGSSLYGNDWVGAAKLAVTSASTPLTIVADLPTDFTSGSAASGMAVSFNPGGATSTFPDSGTSANEFPILFV